ncbi:MAG: urea ABC transporter permease subunit UrtB [Rhodospirillaceae bacterium]
MALPPIPMSFRALLAVLVWLAATALLTGLPARAAETAPLAEAMTGLASRSFADRSAAVTVLAASAEPRALGVLQALGQGALYLRRDDGRLVLGRAGDGDGLALSDPLTGEALGRAAAGDLSRIPLNNALRQTLASVLGRSRIQSADPAERRAAALAMAGEAGEEPGAVLRTALARESDAGVRAVMVRILARITLGSPEAADRLAALRDLAGDATPETRGLVQPLTGGAEPDARVRAAAADLLRAIERRLLITDLLLTLFQGLSLGSVLLLAAVGLAITFGVMGVINMAHGEMIMLGSYTAFTIQQAFRAWLPAELFGLYLVVALPAAFLVSGLVGVALERCVVRFLYRRPLDTLLATFGVSLMLQQAVRSLFGATNMEVANPVWMTGAVEVLPGLVLTWNRIAILLFGLAVLGALGLLLRVTPFGLRMRAVTQNRPMAATMGINSGRIDALTFGLGSGIAGIGGEALSQIGNVSPNLGQTYIIDCFMVVVFGGIGSLWGALAGAVSLGVVNKVLEPVAGAMLGKVLVLALLILFIQKRPRGLFALKGRAADV